LTPKVDPVRRQRPFGRHHAGVVDEHVQARRLRLHALGQGTHRAQLRQVAQLEPRLAAGTLLGHSGPRPFTALGVSSHQPDAGAEPAEALGGRQAESRSCAGDEHDRAPHAPELTR
jgi:hypothetical protein